VTEIAPGVFRLGTPIVNWYLLKDDGRFTAVDSGLPAYGEHLEADLAGLGASIGDIEAVVLTHSDGDHMGMAARMRDAGARVLIHEGDADTLAKPGPKSGDAAPVKLIGQMWRPRFWRFFGHMARAGGGKPPPLEDAETFVDGAVLDVPGRLRVLHTPGHTRGHSSLLLADRGVLFAGDALCTWNPLTGQRRPQPMPHAFNEDNRACVASLDRIAGADAGVLLPGHGDPWHGRPDAAAEQARSLAPAR
jgi:glyoxylase-like metal-dependent hydrolase (beta-lactamase superfamily II)